MSQFQRLTKEEREERYRAVRSMHARQVRQERRTAHLKSFGIAGLGALCGWLAYSNAVLAGKAADVQVVYVTLRDDGTLTNSVRFSSLPENFRIPTVINTLWDYVQSRDCYNATRSARNWYVVQAMSDPRVAREFREWFGPNNPNSPQHVYGDHDTRVDCSFVAYNPIGSAGDRYEIRFDRWEVSERGATPPVRYVASLQFKTGVYSKDPQNGWIDKVTFNAPGVQVTEYPYVKAVPEGVARKEASN